MSIKSSEIETLISGIRIKARIRELGIKISRDYRDRRLTVIFISNGALLFTADLIRNIDLPLQLDSVSTSSYVGQKSSGKVKIMSKLKLDIKGSHILLVDDIIDTGRTITEVVKYLNGFSPSGISTCTLLDKPSRREIPFVADYVGFTVDDLFVVGYGLDYNEYYRNLPYVGVVKNLRAETSF